MAPLVPAGSRPATRDRPTRDYLVRIPRDTMLPAACEDVKCGNWRYGWETFCDERTDLGMMQAAYIRQKSGRDFSEHRTAEGITVFRFASGQRCFGQHHTRPARLLVRDGGRIVREHVSFSDIAEDYTEHVGRLAGQAQKG